jgi:hypothetical protein
MLSTQCRNHYLLIRPAVPNNLHREQYALMYLHFIRFTVKILTNFITMVKVNCPCAILIARYAMKTNGEVVCSVRSFSRSHWLYRLGYPGSLKQWAPLVKLRIPILPRILPLSSYEYQYCLGSYHCQVTNINIASDPTTVKLRISILPRILPLSSYEYQYYLESYHGQVTNSNISSDHKYNGHHCQVTNINITSDPTTVKL